MRSFLLATCAALVMAAPVPAHAWGFEVHKQITARAIPLLPPELRPFYEKYQLFVVEHTIDPDLWRSAGFEQEPPRHFVDLDAYGPYPFTSLPHDYDAAVAKFGAEMVMKNGTLPWRAQEIYDKLVAAFRQAAQPDPRYSLDDIKFFSAALAHYVADSYVPFHAVVNYDGQMTGQWGIHSRFETELVMRNLQQMRLAPSVQPPVRNVREFIFANLTADAPLATEVLADDRQAVKGKTEYDDQYFARLYELAGPIAQTRLSEAISGVAAVIAGAWEQAGRPQIPLESPKVIRKIRIK
jgi:hypothetical protein